MSTILGAIHSMNAQALKAKPTFAEKREICKEGSKLTLALLALGWSAK